MDAKEKPPQLNPLLKLALDLGPLVLFFIANGRFGIFGATGVFMVATVAALATGYVLTRHLPVMPLVTAIVVLIFGGLTIYLQDETFIKIKGKPLLAMVFDQMFHLNPEGWRKLTLRWAIFFFALAVLNEIVWRTQTTDTWVAFKVFGFMPLTFIFAAAQYPLLQKYAVKESASDA
jgi:intracellular septation protein